MAGISYLPHHLSGRCCTTSEFDHDDDRSDEQLSARISVMSISSRASSFRSLFTSFRSIGSTKTLPKKNESVQRKTKIRSQRSLSFPSLSRLAKRRQFDKISRILTDETKDDVAAWLDDTVLTYKIANSSPLHIVIPHRPPVELVNLMCQTMEQTNSGAIPEDSVDVNGVTPLTAAVKAGSDFDVILRLLNGNASTLPAMTVDSERRLPLHWACIPAAKNCRIGTGVDRKQKAISKSVIQLLINAYPQGRSMKDRYGNTPLDLAQKYFGKNNKQQQLQILQDLTPNSTYPVVLKNTTTPYTCVGSAAATAMSTLADDIPREIICFGDYSEHRRQFEIDFSDDNEAGYETLEI